MPTIHASESVVISAPARVVYDLIADYRQGHPSIMPPRYFQNLVVEAGGVGAGTRIRFDMRSFGRVQRLRAEVTEPEPGRRLLEAYPAAGIETTFTVDTAGGGGSSRVTIATRYAKPGPAGWIEGVLAPPLLRRVYREELRLLAERVQVTPATSPA